MTAYFSGQMTRYSITAAWIMIAVVLTVTTGWIGGMPALSTFGAAGAPMVMNTAFAMGLLAAGFLSEPARRPRLARLFGGLAALIGAAVLVQFFADRDLGIDHLFWRHEVLNPQTVPGRMAPLTATAIVLLGGCLAVMSSRIPNYWLAAILGGVALTLALLPLVSYITILSPENSWGSYRGVALPTAICLVLAASIILGWVGVEYSGKGATLALLISAAAVLISIAGATEKNNREWRSSAVKVAHAFKMSAAVDAFVTSLSKLEASTRAYALTGELFFLDQAVTHRADFINNFGVLKRLDAEGVESVIRGDELERLIALKLEASDAVVRGRQLEGVEAAAQAVRAQMPELLVGLVQLTEALRAEETRQLSAAQAAAATTSRNTRLVQWFGTAVALLLVAISAFIAHRAGVAKDAAQKQVALARDQAIEASRMKSEFLANMSHEIRTPMNGVIGMTSLLMETPMSADQREYLETIRASGETLLVLIGDILDFSKIEAGKIELENQAFNLATALEETVILFKAKAHEKQIELLYSVASDVPQLVIGDVTRVRQVTSNLISNALKFTAAGEIEVSAKRVAAQSNEAISTIAISVRDTGIGIPATKFDRLFQPFVQVDASTTRRFGGTGLGLTISKRLSELMGGSLTVTSEERKGSTFTFTFRAESASLQRSISAPPWKGALAGRRMLVVDDNATNRRIVSLYLAGWGMTSVEASGGEEAQAHISQDLSFDGCLLDMNMPDIDGLTLATKLRSLRSDVRLPIIILTSRPKDEISKQAESHKIDAVIDKPIRQGALHRTLQTLFSANTVPLDPAAPSQAPLSALSASHPHTILLAEDNTVNQLVAQKMFERLGYRVDMVANGLEVISALSRRAYDVVFMDVQMPEMDGLQATAAIRGDAKIPQPWIVAMTANAMTGDREKCLGAGMNDYISKPVRIEELRESLRRAPRAEAG